MAENLSKLPLELRLKYIEDMSNIQHELLKSFYDRRPLTERYLDGSVAIHWHVFTSENSFCLTWVKADSNWVLDSSEMPMFVWVGKVSEELRPVAALRRMQPLEHCNVFSSQSAKMPQIFPKVLFRIYNNKLRILYDCLGIEAGQLINQVVQGFPQVLYGVSDEPANPQRSGTVNWEAGGAERHFHLSSSDIHDSLLILQGNVISYRFSEGLNLRSESVQVFPCPVNLLVSAIQRLHYAIIQQHKHIV